MPRRFLAVWPPAPVIASVAELPACRVRPEKLHVTLRFYGEAEVDVAALRALALPSGVAQLGSATATFGRAVLHVPVAGLSSLAAAVDPAPSRPFVGHLTLARARRGEDLRSQAGLPVPAAAQVPWPVEAVTLVASEGGRYTVLEQFATG